MRVLVIGSGSGAMASAVELSLADHEVRLVGRSEATMAPLRANGIGYKGVLGEGRTGAVVIDTAMAPHASWAEAAVVSLPTFAHSGIARAMAQAGWNAARPVVLNPGHTGGALEFATAFKAQVGVAPCVAEFATLAYVARKYRPDEVTVTGRAKSLRAAALPGGDEALHTALALFPGSHDAGDVLATGLANVNMVLHPPGSVMAAAWVEARQGDFTFYVDAMTPGVARVMAGLDGERRRVAAAFGHDLPPLVEEMKRIGTASANADATDLRAAISGGEANARIRAPDALTHRYYTEDFGFGLVPFVALAGVARVGVPTAAALLALGQAMQPGAGGAGRDAAAMGIAGLNRADLLRHVRR